MTSEGEPRANPLVRLGNFFFRYRDALFTAVLLTLFLLFRPQYPRGNEHFDNLLDLIGIGVALIGQLLRVAVIGLAYIIRGGSNRRVYAKNLVTAGFFAHSRNPLYLGNLLVLLGLFLIWNNPWVYLLGGAFFLLGYAAIVAAEEVYLRGKFGSAYDAYARAVPRWLPSTRGLRAVACGHAVQLAPGGGQGIHQHVHLDGWCRGAARRRYPGVPHVPGAHNVPQHAGGVLHPSDNRMGDGTLPQEEPPPPGRACKRSLKHHIRLEGIQMHWIMAAVLATSAAPLSLLTAAALYGQVPVKEWPVPYPDSRPRDPYVDGKNRVWFVGQVGNYIAYLDPATGKFRRYEIEDGALPHNLIVDQKDMVWYAGNGNGHIGKLDPATGKVTRYPMPNPGGP